MISKLSLSTLLLLASSAFTAPVPAPNPAPGIIWHTEIVTVYETGPAPTEVAAPPPPPPPAYTPPPPPPVQAAPPPTKPENEKYGGGEQEAAAPQQPAPVNPKPVVAAGGGTSPGGSKRGLCFNNGNAGAAPFTSSKITWGYNWGTNRDADTLPSNVVDFVPMCWGIDKDCSGIDQAIADGAKYVLGYNEPDHEGQAWCPAGAAAGSWNDKIGQYAGKAQIGGPGITSTNAPGKGISWLGEFIDACSTCKIDFWPVHWYTTNPDVTQELAAFTSHLGAVKTLLEEKKKPVRVWVTEFGMDVPDDQLQAAFLKGAMEYMDSQPWIERYAYFAPLNDGPSNSRLVNGGALTAAGQIYNQ